MDRRVKRKKEKMQRTNRDRRAPTCLLLAQEWIELRLPEALACSSFVSGRTEDGRLQVEYYRSQHAEGILAKVRFGPATVGPPGHVHGGAIAAVLDEAMGLSVALAGQPGMTAELHVRFRKPVPLNSVAIIQPRIREHRARRVGVRADLVDAGTGTIYANASAVFVPVCTDSLLGASHDEA
jgi:acyl-coenzyme A thioesterase PaaI-like protein